MRHLLWPSLLSLACSGPSSPKDPPEQPFFPVDFRERLTQVRDCRLSPAEHDGFYVDVYASKSAAKAYTEGSYPFEPGTLLVKGEYEDEDCLTLARISAMKRLEDGEAPELGDWAWQRTAPDGEVLEASERSCAGCHASCKSSDRACTEE